MEQGDCSTGLDSIIPSVGPQRKEVRKGTNKAQQPKTNLARVCTNAKRENRRPRSREADNASPQIIARPDHRPPQKIKYISPAYNSETLQQRQTHRVLHVMKLEDSPEDLSVTAYQTTIAKISKKTGDITLNSGGYRTIKTRLAINIVLQCIGLVVEVDPKVEQEWTVTGTAGGLSMPFHDNMVIGALPNANRSLTLARASLVSQAMKQKLAGIKTRQRNENI